MRTNLTNIKLVAIMIAITFIYSCKPDKIVTTPNDFANGVFVVEQGQFTNGTGTLSFINKSTNKITNNVFGVKNNQAIGNVLQSMNIINGSAYLVVNNSDKIVVCNAANLQYTTTITGTRLPRYIKQVSDTKAYVSEWGDTTDGAIRVLNLATNTFSKRIQVGNGAEQMIVYGDRAFISCNGAFGSNDSIAIVNTIYDTLIAKIYVGANPESMVQDADNNIWILCKGAWNSTFSGLAKPATLIRYNTFNNAIDRTFSLPAMNNPSTPLCINGAKNVLYYISNGGCWRVNTNATALATYPMFEGNFFGVSVDPATEILYTADAKDYNSNGIVRSYNPYGQKIDSFTTGIIPSELYFTK